MIRLIRSNLYQMLHIKPFWVSIIAFAAVIIGAPFLQEIRSGNDYILAQADSAAIAVIIPIFTAYLAGHGYHQRTCMYEVMSGNSTGRILFSKLISIALFPALIFECFSLMGFGIACTMGCDHTGELLLRQGLLFILILRSTVIGVLITACVRSLGGVALVYLRILAETFILLIYSAVTDNNSFFSDSAGPSAGLGSKILNTVCISEQPMLIAGAPLDSCLFLTVFLGFSLELLLWWAVSYMIYQRKDY